MRNHSGRLAIVRFLSARGSDCDHTLVRDRTRLPADLGFVARPATRPYATRCCSDSRNGVENYVTDSMGSVGLRECASSCPLLWLRKDHLVFPIRLNGAA